VALGTSWKFRALSRARLCRREDRLRHRQAHYESRGATRDQESNGDREPAHVAADPDRTVAPLVTGFDDAREPMQALSEGRAIVTWHTPNDCSLPGFGSRTHARTPNKHGRGPVASGAACLKVSQRSPTIRSDEIFADHTSSKH
jgi:hypothetical protein